MGKEIERLGQEKVPYVPNDAYSGITKREYFAAKAMQGILSNEGFNNMGTEEKAWLSVDMADALIKKLI